MTRMEAPGPRCQEMPWPWAEGNRAALSSVSFFLLFKGLGPPCARRRDGASRPRGAPAATPQPPPTRTTRRSPPPWSRLQLQHAKQGPPPPPRSLSRPHSLAPRPGS